LVLLENSAYLFASRNSFPSASADLELPLFFSVHVPDSNFSTNSDLHDF